LTERGLNEGERRPSPGFTRVQGTYGRNRPVLLRNDRSTIKESFARNILNYRCKCYFFCIISFYVCDICTVVAILVYENRVCENASLVEDQLQRSLHERLPLGIRLWRAIAKGGFSEEKKQDRSLVWKVFVGYFPKEMLTTNQIIVNR
jgi:hypothetical protein